MGRIYLFRRYFKLEPKVLININQGGKLYKAAISDNGLKPNAGQLFPMFEQFSKDCGDRFNVAMIQLIKLFSAIQHSV